MVLIFTFIFYDIWQTPVR